ncbi:hypothetical protein [Priestia sp. P5]|nr:hypothetical protein [Priestia sp. P5]
MESMLHRGCCMHEIYVHPTNEKIRESWILNQEFSSFGFFFN